MAQTSPVFKPAFVDLPAIIADVETGRPVVGTGNAPAPSLLLDTFQTLPYAIPKRLLLDGVTGNPWDWSGTNSVQGQPGYTSASEYRANATLWPTGSSWDAQRQAQVESAITTSAPGNATDPGVGESFGASLEIHKSMSSWGWTARYANSTDGIFFPTVKGPCVLRIPAKLTISMTCQGTANAPFSLDLGALPHFPGLKGVSLWDAETNSLGALSRAYDETAAPVAWPAETVTANAGTQTIEYEVEVAVPDRGFALVPCLGSGFDAQILAPLADAAFAARGAYDIFNAYFNLTLFLRIYSAYPIEKS